MMTMPARLIRLLTLAALISACGSEPLPEGTRVYRHALDGAPTSLDPAHAASVYANFVIVNLYDTLYSYRYLARPYQLKPNLAATLPNISEDGLVYTISLKQGVYFTDDAAFAGGQGRLVTAADVIYSLQRHFDPASRSQGAWLWRQRIDGLEAWAEAGADYAQPVAGLTALDPYTVEIRLTRPFSQLPYTLASGFAAIVAHEAVDHYGREFGLNPVGSGPFRLEQFDTTKAVLRANPNYRQEPVDLVTEGYLQERDGALGLEQINGRSPPFLEQVEIHFIQEDATRWASFTAGDEIHHTRVPRDQVGRILSHTQPPQLRAEQAERYTLHSGVDTDLIHLSFNMDDARLGYHPDPQQAQRNRALRCAIRQAFDWRARNRAFFADLGIVFPGVIPPLMEEFDPTLSSVSIEHDLAAAQASLAANGWTSDQLPSLDYGFASGVTQLQGYEQFRSQMVALGFAPGKVHKQAFATFGDYSRAMKNGQVLIMLRSWTLDYPDAENILQLFYGPNAAPGSNHSNYRNPHYNQLYRQAEVLPPSAQRTALYRRMNEILIDDCVVIAGLSPRRLFLTHKDLVAKPDQSVLGGFFVKYVDWHE